MRYHILAQMAEICDSLQEAIVYISSCDNVETNKMLLNTCDEMLGAMISTLESQANQQKYHSAIDNLKDIKKALSSKENIDKLAESLIEAKKTIINTVDIKYRIVFFAELGEKWDSLETIYKAFLQKENCDVSIVLAPIFREHGGKQEIIYKDYFTPLGIPFIEYKDYDIEKDMPDVAFTCQPYESVTAPMFWAQNIAKHTRLVYVPYFAAHMFYDGSIDTMCTQPIFYHGWKTIGSSQKHYAFYKKHAHDGGKNMIITGVPKWDGVIKLKSDGVVQQSEAWDVKLKGKMVFVWNSFYDLYSSSIKYWPVIMKYFASHTDCALIWRMHPMTKTVAKVYASEDEQQSLINMESLSYQMPNVIIDNNTSYLEAFWRSDALISDFSSMMTQYLLLDKPLLWLKNPSWEPTECAIDNSWMETADNENEIIEFFERIRAHKDKNKGLREIVRQRDIPLADGKSGERVCDIILKLLHKETIEQL